MAADRVIGSSRVQTRRPSRAVIVASFILALSAWAAAWGIETLIDANRTGARRDDVRTVLADGRSLLAARARLADAQAAQLASTPEVQDAYARRDAAALQRIAASRASTSFVLWTGVTVGSAAGLEPQAAIGVFASSGRIGEVIVAAPPDAQALARTRASSPTVGLVYSIGGRVVAASPPAPNADLPSLLRATISSDVVANGRTDRPAYLYAYVSKPHIPAAPVWPVLVALVVGLGSYSAFGNREARRRAEPPSNQVRDAVALVGETLAATHNPRALLPVILRASVEATGASGGTIEHGGAVVASRGMRPLDPSESIDLTLEIDESTPALMRLYPPPGGFRDDAREAAAWIGSQALIALENARLHGLVQRQAVTDELTGLANRRRFLTALETEIGRSRRTGSPLSVVIADIDDFKKVNDTWGHDVGDEALRRFAAILRSTVRDVDLPVRLGGEEFAILLPETDLAGAALLADRVRETIEASVIETPKATFAITASFGVSSFPSAGTAETILSEADQRLYEAKRRGKNRVIPASAPQAQVG